MTKPSIPLMKWEDIPIGSLIKFGGTGCVAIKTGEKEILRYWKAGQVDEPVPYEDRSWTPCWHVVSTDLHPIVQAVMEEVGTE